MDAITSRFPNVLFESCSGGGGRFDPAILYYMPQTWTSDNTDAVCRLKIQYGTSIVYPPSTICSHVSVSPNEQIGRITPLQTRGYVAMSGNFGYELDLSKLSKAEKEEVRRQVALYKEIRPLIQFGVQHRLLSPFNNNEASWLYVSQDGSEVVVFYFIVLAQPAVPIRILRLRGLDPTAQYRDLESGKIFGGDELLSVGLTVPVENGDFTSQFWHFKRI
jgi:alpha-galactosidase